MKPIVGMPVQYFTCRTLSKQQTADGKIKKVRLPEPVQLGPFAALIVAVKDDGVVDLVVFQHASSNHPAFNVTQEPSTTVQHYWRHIPYVEAIEESENV